jgi:hypothetical protein
MGKKASQPRLGRGPVPDIYTLPVPEQLDRLRGLVEFLDHEWEMLDRSFDARSGGDRCRSYRSVPYDRGLVGVRLDKKAARRTVRLEHL